MHPEVAAIEKNRQRPFLTFHAAARRTALVFASFVVLLLTASLNPAAAQGQAQAGNGATYQFNLPEQPLSDALKGIGQLTSTNVLFDPGSVLNKRAPALRARLTAAEAIERVLRGTDLAARRTAADTVLVQPVSTKQARDTGKIELTLADTVSPQDAAVVTSQEAQQISGGGDAILDGHVTDTVGGSSLPGALVRLVETGGVTHTDTLGYFRFSGLAPGRYTLTISYLGYAEKSWPASAEAGAQVQEYPLAAESEVAQITVYGTRSARAKALNQQRTAENSTSVISADVLGNFTDATIAEALRRAPGITFRRDRETGVGTDISIRGLGLDMNTIKLNGLVLPAGNVNLRTPSLNTLLAGSVEKITINESLLPSHDSAGTGGLIEIVTKSPLTRPHRYLNFSAEGGGKANGFGDDRAASGTISGTFGAGRNFGLSASVQVRRKEDRTFGYGTGLIAGQYLPLDESGNPTIFYAGMLDPRSAFPFEAGAAAAFPYQVNSSLAEASTDNDAYTVSAEWQVSDSTDLRLDLVRSSEDRFDFSRDTTFGTSLRYSLQPVAALDGELRQSLGWDGFANMDQFYTLQRVQTTTQSYGLNGKTTAGRFELTYVAGFARGSTEYPQSYDFDFMPHLDTYDFPIAPDMVAPGAIDPVEGRVLSLFGRRHGRDVPLPLLTRAGWDFVNDPASYNFLSGTSQQSKTVNDRYTGELNARWNVQGRHLKYLEAGANYETSKYALVSSNGFYIDANYFAAPDPGDPDNVIYTTPNLPMLGIGFDASNLSKIHQDGPSFSVISRRELDRFIARLSSLAGGNDPLLTLTPTSIYRDPLQNQQGLHEKNLATYFQGHVQFGKLSIIGGIRVSDVDVRSSAYSAPDVIRDDGSFDEEFYELNKRVVDTGGRALDYLPRFQFNYRQTENLIFRSSYYLTVARPAPYQLSSQQNVSLNLADGGGPFYDQPSLNISQGNPDLKPSFTHNFDLGVERYDQHIGVMKLSLFYKRIDNLLLLNQLRGSKALGKFVKPAHDPEGYFDDLSSIPGLDITFQQPENSGDLAENWGVSAALERQFTFLPGFWSGFGVYANYTYARNSYPQLYDWFRPVLDADGNIVDFSQVTLKLTPHLDPSRSGTLSLTYNLHDIDASLTYTRQERQAAGFAANNLVPVSRGMNSLDLRVEYQMDRGTWGRYSVYLEGSDLLKSATSPDIEEEIGGSGSTPNFFTGGSFLGGRTVRLGMTASF